MMMLLMMNYHGDDDDKKDKCFTDSEVPNPGSLIHRAWVNL